MKILSGVAPRRVRSKSCLLILVLTLGTTANAQTISPLAKDADELTRLLQEFLAGASRNDVAAHDRFWAGDVIYTGSGGKRRVKADIMQDVRSAPAPKPSDPTTVTLPKISAFSSMQTPRSSPSDSSAQPAKMERLK
jgi:hypothetical protein